MGDHSVADVDNVRLLPVDRLLRRAGVVDPVRRPDFSAAMRAVMAC